MIPPNIFLVFFGLLWLSLQERYSLVPVQRTQKNTKGHAGEEEKRNYLSSSFSFRLVFSPLFVGFISKIYLVDNNDDIFLRDFDVVMKVDRTFDFPDMTHGLHVQRSNTDSRRMKE